jgi:hypothetical protein
VKPGFEEISPKPVSAEFGAPASRTRDWGQCALTRAMTLFAVKQQSLRQEKFVEVCVYGDSSLRQPITHPLRGPFKNCCWRLRLPIVPRRSGRPDCLFADLALLSGALAGQIRSPRRSSRVCPFPIGAQR